MATFPLVEHVSVTIERPPAEVYGFVAEPRNLPRWARGLSGTRVEEVDGQWVADSPMGRVRVRFAPANALGVVDHDVELPDGTIVHNPLRVLANGSGSEVVFTLFRRPATTDEAVAADAEAVRRDLLALKRLLEAGGT